MRYLSKERSFLKCTLHVVLQVHIALCALPPSVHVNVRNQKGSDSDVSISNAWNQHTKQFWNDNSKHETGSSKSRHHRWATAAFNYVTSLNCDDVFFTTSRECNVLVSTSQSEMNIYIASPSSYGKFRTVIPDEPLTGSGLHDAVIVVDPFPEANFGHLVVVFFLDSSVSLGHCQKMGGVLLDEDECMHLALRRRCHNLLERHSRRRNFARRCEINFLPVVHLDTGNSDSLTSSHHQQHEIHFQNHHGTHTHPYTNYLECKPQLAGFGACPQLLSPANGSEEVACDHLRDNTRRCFTTHESVRTSCRMFEICDQAILISGGWNYQASGPRHLKNLQVITRMLRDNGFKRRNIKIFFANGAPPLQVGQDLPHKVYPSTMKLAIRNHLHRMCLSFHCVDSLFLYLNSPARSDGTALLWDADGDGLADSDERYTVRELKEDLSGCAAKQVTLVVDQSFAGEILPEFRQSPFHTNVIIFASGKSGEYAFNDEFTRFWASQNHTRTCSADVHHASHAHMQRSSPRMAEGAEGRVRTTIFGAPCDVRPPFTARELRQSYYGCQNIPTAVWLRQILRASDTSAVDDTDDYKEEVTDEES